MAVNVEQLGALERRVSMSVPAKEVDRQVDDRLKKLARNVRMAGFRPGKVPMKMVVQQYGPQVRSEVIGDAVQKAFSDAVKEANLKVAGNPRIEKKDGAADAAVTYEPDEESILADLLPRNVAIQLYRAMRENAASEQGSKMTAMDNATRNAGDLINRLTIQYNRTRQAAITTELVEIISGAEAL